jgi:dTMP kinase
MLTDRYIYSLIVRAIARGADPEWIKQVYSFSLKPDAVFYLRIEVPSWSRACSPTADSTTGSPGMDIPMGEDLFESFIRYQRGSSPSSTGCRASTKFHNLDATGAWTRSPTTSANG